MASDPSTPAMKPLTEAYLEWLSIAIDAEGVGLPHAIARDRDGATTMYALDLTTDQGYRMMLAEWVRKDLREMIFGFDRFTKPGQGTTLGDAVAGWHFDGADRRSFVIEYQHEPRIVKPIAWDNVFWNAALGFELTSVCRSVVSGSRQ